MYRLEPISLTAESDNTYIVRFKSDEGVVEYKFTATFEPVLGVQCEIAYSDVTNGDPAVPILARAIAQFHEARHYQYDPD